MATTTITVPEIHCDHCKSAIEGALSPLDGVRRAEVHIDALSVAVDYDEARVDRATLVSEIEDQGYEVPADRD